MAEIGIFPLPLVLVPTERIPLHIFEPRYKELVDECLETGKPFGLVLATGDGAVHEVGTTASVEEVLEVLEDGAMNIVVEGRERFRLLELTTGRSFTTCLFEPVVDDDEPPTAEESARAYELFQKLAEATGADVDLPDPEIAQLDFELVARVDFGVDAKQELIAATSPRRRMQRLAELLELALETTTLQQALKERAGLNGKVSPLDPDHNEP
jgi:Lon protease-like protein